jgi:hypothetical protein
MPLSGMNRGFGLQFHPEVVHTPRGRNFTQFYFSRFVVVPPPGHGVLSRKQSRAFGKNQKENPVRTDGGVDSTVAFLLKKPQGTRWRLFH